MAAIEALLTLAMILCRGQYTGPEPPRMAVLKAAAAAGAQYVDVEHLAAKTFFDSECACPLVNICMVHQLLCSELQAVKRTVPLNALHWHPSK